MIRSLLFKVLRAHAKTLLNSSAEPYFLRLFPNNTLSLLPEPFPNNILSLLPEPFPNNILSLLPEPFPNNILSLLLEPFPNNILSLLPEPFPNNILSLLPEPFPNNTLSLLPEPFPNNILSHRYLTLSAPYCREGAEKLNMLCINTMQGNELSLSLCHMVHGGIWRCMCSQLELGN